MAVGKRGQGVRGFTLTPAERDGDPVGRGSRRRAGTGRIGEATGQELVSKRGTTERLVGDRPLWLNLHAGSTLLPSATPRGALIQMQSGDPAQPFIQSRARLADQVRAVLAGRYRIERELGHGGMAIAYLAENLDFKRLVAIKVLRPDKGFEAGAVERFRTEAVAVAQLRHPHIIGVHARGEEGDILWFEMDFIDGGSLDDKIAAGQIAPRTVARYVAQAADALAYAHARGIIHRDIKPSNLLIAAGTDHLVITDFGIAKILGKTSLTETGVTVGTMAYMSPEQLAADRNLTSAADQYSLGVVAYQSLLGSLPYAGTSPGQFVAAQIQRTAPSILTERPDCPPDLAKLIERMLAPTPEARWQDMLLVRRAAEEIALNGEAPVLRGAIPPIRRRTLASWRRGPLVVMSSIVLALAGLGYFAWERRPTPLPSLLGSVLRPQPTAEVRDTGRRDSAARQAGVIPSQTPVESTRSDKKAVRDNAAKSSSRGAGTSGKPAPAPTAPADTMHEVAPVPPPPPPPQVAAPQPTTAVLSIRSKLPGTFIYINGDNGRVHAIPVDTFVDITVPPGKVHLRITSNQPGCVDVEDDVNVAAGARKTMYRNANCPNP